MGYQGKSSGGGPTPHHGYYYKILTAQGKDAPGGAYSYIVKGKMIGGFAVVAHPAEYGNSGIMTFIVNHDGKVFQKDFGQKYRRSCERDETVQPRLDVERSQGVTRMPRLAFPISKT